MMKRAIPKRVTLHDDRMFVARYERVPRSTLPKRCKYRGQLTRRQGGRGIVSVIKSLLQFGKKIVTSRAARNLAKNIANKALDKAPDIIDSLSNRINNKTLKK